MALKEIWNKLSYLIRRGRFHSELADEMEFHIESRADELMATGQSRRDALAQARREFGSSLRLSEETHSAWQMRWMEDLFSDVRFAGRALRRSPGFAITAVVCLALGIGANTTIFSITAAFLFGQPSCRDAASVISIWEGGNSAAPYSDYKFVRDARIFDGMAGIDPESYANWRNGDGTRRLFAALVSDDYFTTLGIPIRQGRGVLPRETNTVVISERLWRTAFNADPGILQQTMTLDGQLYNVVGVLPADHRTVLGFAIAPDIYVPARHDTDHLMMYARLPSGMNRAAARARLLGVFQQLDRIHPEENWKRTEGVRITGVVGPEAFAGEALTAILAFFGMLMAMVSLVLLIACTNVASLLLARASNRAQEIAVRLSLGASRSRIVRHLLAESLLIAGLGGVAGLLLNSALTHLIAGVDLPIAAPVHIVITPDTRLVVYAACIAIASAFLSGLVPALTSARRDANAALKNGQRQTVRTWGFRSVLVAGQIAVSIVLLSVGFLFLHSLRLATAMNPGFDLDHTVWASMRVVPDDYAQPARLQSLASVALERLRGLSGIQAAAITSRVPLNDNCTVQTSVRTDVSATPTRLRWQCNEVTPDYFRAIGIPLVRGREFTMADRKGPAAVAIVNESFARTLFGDKDPIGHTITANKPMLIVGVVKDSKYFTFTESQRLASTSLMLNSTQRPR